MSGNVTRADASRLSPYTKETYQAVTQKTCCVLGSRLLQTSLTRTAVRAAEWLRNQQDENGTYGEGHVTAVALHSLRLVGFPVEQGAEHLNAEIIENDIGSIPGARVGSYILGALASCQNPKSFYDFDLARALITKLDKFPRLRFDHPYQYSFAVMALCSTGAMRLDYLQNIMRDIPEQLETEDGVSGDTLSMQVMALTCAKKSMKKKDMKALKSKIQVAIDLASKELQTRQMNDSTFGENEVTAALVSQVSRGNGRGAVRVCMCVGRERRGWGRGSNLPYLTTLGITGRIMLERIAS